MSAHTIVLYANFIVSLADVATASALSITALIRHSNDSCFSTKAFFSHFTVWPWYGNFVAIGFKTSLGGIGIYKEKVGETSNTIGGIEFIRHHVLLSFKLANLLHRPSF